MCKKDDEALRLLREVVTESPGRPEEGEKNSDNITNKDSRGTRKDYTLDRLAREDAELYEKVVADEMSALPRGTSPRAQADPCSPPYTSPYTGHIPTRTEAPYSRLQKISDKAWEIVTECTRNEVLRLDDAVTGDVTGVTFTEYLR